VIMLYSSGSCCTDSTSGRSSSKPLNMLPGLTVEVDNLILGLDAGPEKGGSNTCRPSQRRDDGLVHGGLVQSQWEPDEVPHCGDLYGDMSSDYSLELSLTCSRLLLVEAVLRSASSSSPPAVNTTVSTSTSEHCSQQAGISASGASSHQQKNMERHSQGGAAFASIPNLLPQVRKIFWFSGRQH
jgi:hypothetical protein